MAPKDVAEWSIAEVAEAWALLCELQPKDVKRKR